MFPACTSTDSRSNLICILLRKVLKLKATIVVGCMLGFVFVRCLQILFAIGIFLSSGPLRVAFCFSLENLLGKSGVA